MAVYKSHVERLHELLGEMIQIVPNIQSCEIVSTDGFIVAHNQTGSYDDPFIEMWCAVALAQAQTLAQKLNIGNVREVCCNYGAIQILLIPLDYSDKAGYDFMLMIVYFGTVKNNTISQIRVQITKIKVLLLEIEI